ncbi:MAG: sigma 54-interacting transcriptional regulator [Vicinamibacterales bacterium]|nr:sigma 54-interacting transcriptional regulator [Vicinamibacterales bacterium]
MLQQDPTGTASELSEFERFVTELAVSFVEARPEKVDEVIVNALARLAECLNVDRCSWWQVSGLVEDAEVAHTWTRPEFRVLQSGESASMQVPWILSRMQQGEIVSYARAEDLPSPEDRQGVARFGAKSGAAIPFMVAGQFRGVLGCTTIRDHREWSPAVIARLRLVTAVFGQMVVRQECEERFADAVSELQELRDTLLVENQQLRRRAKSPATQSGIVAESQAARLVLEQVEVVAPTGATVLLLGETGCGKEVFAQAIHRMSERRGRAMVTINCAALPPTLIESELFGRERGAFTGALSRQIGRFEMAHDSTIFLDEIGDLPLDAQVKLLRVLQEKVIERLGGGQPVKVDVRIIAATNRNLQKAVEDRAFREDLFYRLNVFPITVPPLRERTADIPALCWAFIEEYSKAFRKPIDSISKESIAALSAYHWPGNIRELRNVIERAVIISKGPRLVVQMPATGAETPANSNRLDEIEAGQIQRVLEQVGWRVRGRGGAAELLGLKPNTLDSRMLKLGIRRPGSAH